MTPQQYATYLVNIYGRQQATVVIDKIIQDLSPTATDDLIYYRQVSSHINPQRP